MRNFFILGLLCTNSIFAKPSFTQLLNNFRWYRSFDSTSTIIPAEGKLLFAWDFVDQDKQVDSFFVGIDTLWGLPQNVDGDTASDWDLQICPDEICLNGLKAGIHGANSPYPFGPTKFQAEHHMQFFPAISVAYDFIAPPKSLFGAIMFCRSRSTGISDTVLAFGAWKLKWDTLYSPPPRPVNGYLPKLSDFVISGDTVRYLKSGAQIQKHPHLKLPSRLTANVSFNQLEIHIGFVNLLASAEIGVYTWNGKKLWSSKILDVSKNEITVNVNEFKGGTARSGYYLVRLVGDRNVEWAPVLLLQP
jgi:hypothetical protein